MADWYKQHERASELYEPEEVFDVVFVSCDQAAVVLHPGKVPFHLSAPAVAAQAAHGSGVE
jgi:hypothetical protein